MRFAWPARLLAAGLSLLAGHCLAAPPAPEALPAAAQPRFEVQEYRVLGNTVLTSRDIESLLYPLLGASKQLTDVEAARAALEKLYHDRGFGTVFVDIPPQDVNEGIVRLHVTEATLHERKIEGAHYFSERDIVAALPAAKVGAVPSLSALQQQLADINSQTTDRSVVPVLKAGPVPGTLDLDLKVTDKLPLHGSAELDDNYTADTKSLRASAGVSYGNLFQALDSVSFQYQFSPQDFSEVRVLDASYSSRPFFGGYRASGYFIDSNSNVSNIGAGSTGVLGKGQIMGLRLSFPPIVATDLSQLITLGIDYKHFRNVITAGGTSQPLTTPISYTNLSVSYVGSLHFQHVDADLTVTPNFGLRTAPGSAAAFENDRFLARADYVYLRWDGSVTYRAPADYRVMLRLAGQEANEPLISNENDSIGGIDGVRGYLEAEELGDTALKGTLQFQTPNYSWRIPQLFNAFAFFDAGHVHEYATLPGQSNHTALASWGMGVNLLPARAVNGVLIWADPLKTGSYTMAHDSRILFSVRGAF